MSTSERNLADIDPTEDLITALSAPHFVQSWPEGDRFLTFCGRSGLVGRDMPGDQGFWRGQTNHICLDCRLEARRRGARLLGVTLTDA